MLSSGNSLGKTSTLLSALTPSTLSGLVCVVVGLLFVGNLLLSALLRGSYLPVIIFEWANLPAFWQEGDLSYDMAWGDFTNTSAIFILWATLGLALLSVVRWIIRTRAGLVEVNQDMQTVGYNRAAVVKQELVRLGFRLLAVVGWAAYLWLFFGYILHYIVAATLAAGGNLADLQNVGFLLVALLMTILSLHLHVVFARLAALRPRLFGAA